MRIKPITSYCSRGSDRISEHGRDYWLGHGLTVAPGGAMHVELGVDAHSHESPMLGGVDTGVLGRATMRW